MVKIKYVRKMGGSNCSKKVKREKHNLALKNFGKHRAGMQSSDLRLIHNVYGEKRWKMRLENESFIYLTSRGLVCRVLA
jgi:hypothetical protein